MVTITPTSVIAAQGVSSLLAGSDTSGGLFSALSGQQDTSNQGLIDALAGHGGTPQSVASILQQQQIDSTKLGIYANAAQRIDYIQQGQLEPTSDWEKIVGYAMNKGLPSVVFIDTDGSVQAQLQSEADLSKYNLSQQSALLDNMIQIETMAQKIQANATNDSWVKKLAGASNDVYMVANLVLQLQDSTPNNWEQTAVLLATNGQPQKISLDTNGDLQAFDQRYDPANADLPEGYRTKLMDAIALLQSDFALMDAGEVQRSALPLPYGTAFDPFESDAYNMAKSKIPYYLEVDTITGVISAKENSADNITPDFLKTAPYPDVGDDTDTLKQVATFIEANKPYFLDIDTTGKVVAKDMTTLNLTNYNKAKATSTTGTGSILSLFA
ncbi:hypothetical protein [Paramagnetospirillum kuznetsovii]|nr:hypothetical protein [Paramagnetospirillum kuznetsovii]